MSAAGSTFETGSLTRTHWAAIVLAAITGVIHLVLGVQFIPDGLGWAFLLAGLGFLGAIVLLLRGYRGPRLYLVGIVFTGIQVPLYVVVNWPDVVSPLGLGDKLVQVALVGLLVVLYRDSR